MSSKSNEWEVVLKRNRTAPQKSIKKGDGKKVKKDHEQAQKRLLAQLNPRGASPVTPTGFGRAFQDSRPPLKKKTSLPTITITQVPAVAPPKPKLKKKKTMKSAADSITVEILAASMCDWEEKYPNIYETQLQRLAEFFEKSFSQSSLGPNREQLQKQFHRRIQIPAAYLSEDVYQLLHKWILVRRIPDDSLDSFFWFLLSTLVSVETKATTWHAELTGIGLRILLQILIRDSKIDFLDQNKKLIDERLCKKGKLPTATLGIFVWLGGQHFFGAPTRALQAWLQWCLPAVSVAAKPASKREQHQAFALHYLRALLDPSLKFTPPAHEQPFVHGAERLLLSCSSESTPQEFVQLIPNALSLLFSLCEVPCFAMLLSHAASSRPTLRTKSLELLVDQLIARPHLVETWVSVYAENIAQSNNLMLCLRERWPTLRDRLPKASLESTIVKILKINKSLLIGKYIPPRKTAPRKIGPEDVVDINMCTITGKALLEKVNEQRWLAPALLISVPLFLLSSGLTLYNCCINTFYTTDYCSEIEPYCARFST